VIELQLSSKSADDLAVGAHAQPPAPALGKCEEARGFRRKRCGFIGGRGAEPSTSPWPSSSLPRR
jgi:hypothetical protein